MKNNSLRKIGKVLSAHGIRGDLYIGVFSEDVSWLTKLNKLTLVSGTESICYQVIMKKPFKKGFICHLKDVDDRNLSETLKSAEVWVDEAFFISKDGEQPYLSELLNFSVINQEKTIGTIHGFSSNGAQDLLIVKDEKSTYEIPFIKEFVLDMNFSEKKLLMQLPEGLLNLNDDE